MVCTHFKALDNPKPLANDLEKVDDVDESNDLFLQFRGMLILGRILGVIPLRGVFTKSHNNLESSLYSFSCITSLICVAVLLLDTGISVVNAIQLEKKSLIRVADSIKYPLFACWGLFIYMYFILHCQKFISIFKIWEKVNRTLTYTEKDTKLKLTIVIIGVVMFSSTFLENALLHFEYFEVFDDISGNSSNYTSKNGYTSVLQIFYWRTHAYWGRYLGYHPIWAFLSFLVHKCSLYGWNYIDVTAALFFRVLYFKFKALNKLAEEKLLDSQIHGGAPKEAWMKLARDHDALCEILNVMNSFFSPIIFASYTVNIYIFCMQLVFGINPDGENHSILLSIYYPWSFIHLFIRMFLLTLFASRVNDYAHGVREIVMRCPDEFVNSGPIVKLDKKVNGGTKLGISGLGCFVVTKPFMLSLLNVVFTLEIVLMQGLASEREQSKKG